MNVFSGIGPLPRHSWLFCSVALLFLTACATTRAAEESSSGAKTVDVGYGTVDPDQTAGSVVTVRGDEVMADRSRTLAEMLVGIPGVQVTDNGSGGISVRIRETNSFLGGEDPLVVIDGMVVSGGLNGINPNVIESISVLKNAGDTAIYGSRGANGVILIRTKRGSG